MAKDTDCDMVENWALNKKFYYCRTHKKEGEKDGCSEKDGQLAFSGLLWSESPKKKTVQSVMLMGKGRFKAWINAKGEIETKAVSILNMDPDILYSPHDCCTLTFEDGKFKLEII